MTKIYLVAIDQGTTGSTVMILDVRDTVKPKVVAKHNVEFKQHYPKPGWVEHDLEDIWESVNGALRGACGQIADFSWEQVHALGITNQRETLCVFDKKTGLPVRRAIVWQDKRSEGICQELRRHEDEIIQKTGLVVDPYFSGTKMTWLMRHDPETATAIRQGRALWGTIDSYLVYRLTATEQFVTEPSNASRTLLFDIELARFDEGLLELFEIPHRDSLPRVVDSAQIMGHTQSHPVIPDGIPIGGILGDQQAALAGQTCFQPSDAKCTYGTGAFLLMNTGTERLHSKHGLLSTIAWRLNGQVSYAFEGATFIAGAAMQFLRDQLQLIPSAELSEAWAREVKAAPLLYFVPSLAGLGAPYWNSKAKGAFFGLTRGTQKEEIVRAALEGMAFSVYDLYQAMKEDAKQEGGSLKVDGGACQNNLLMEIQAFLLDLPVDRPKIIETTAFGAAIFAGLGVGVYKNLDELSHMRATDRMFRPDSDPKKRLDQLEGWQRAVKAVEVFAGS